MCSKAKIIVQANYWLEKTKGMMLNNDSSKDSNELKSHQEKQEG